MHGFAFNVVALGQPLGPTSNENPRMTLNYFKELEKNNLIEKDLTYPPGKDTIPVPNNGYTVIRFRANNIGINIFIITSVKELVMRMIGVIEKNCIFKVTGCSTVIRSSIKSLVWKLFSKLGKQAICHRSRKIFQGAATLNRRYKLIIKI